VDPPDRPGEIEALLLDVWPTSVRMGDGLLISRKVGPKVHHELRR
jgi:hypothetical protein